MTSIKELSELGKELGYEGEKLRTFIEESQNKEREVRAEMYARKKEEYELKEREMQETYARKKEEYELKQKEKQEEYELKQREYELKEREMHELHRIKEAEHQMAMELEEARRIKAPGVSKPSLQIKVPKLPFFDENKDNMDSYLSRFERYAESQN